jgi:hypothetical protein
MFLPYARVLPMHLAIILGLILGHAGHAANPETEATER